MVLIVYESMKLPKNNNMSIHYIKHEIFAWTSLHETYIYHIVNSCPNQHPRWNYELYQCVALVHAQETIIVAKHPVLYKIMIADKGGSAIKLFLEVQHGRTVMCKCCT